MDALKTQKAAEITTSNITADTSSPKTATSGSSVPVSARFNVGDGIIGDMSQSFLRKCDNFENNAGDFIGGSPRVKNSGAVGSSISGQRTPRSSFTPRGADTGLVYRNCNSDNFVSNSQANFSPNTYRRSLPPKGAASPTPGFRLKMAQNFSNLTIKDSVNTAGAAGGGDAPYLGSGKSNIYNGNSLTLNNTCRYHYCYVDAITASGNNIPLQQKLNEQRPQSTGDALGTERMPLYSRKVFVGGLPPDINEEELITAFRRFGPLVIDWPHKVSSKSEYPPKGYAFLIFHEENSVQQLVEACVHGDDKLYLCVSSSGIKDKPVQLRPWRLTDASYILNSNIPLDPRKTVFVGGVPRPLKAYELAMVMDRLYGGVCYAGIDTDPELKYPKGAGRVVFYSHQSYIAAISARFVQLQHGDIDKRVEVKPYVLGNQSCDECRGQRCNGKSASFFCTSLTCLQYYCDYCWAAIHSWPGRQYHKPLVKEGGERPRVTYRW